MSVRTLVRNVHFYNASTGEYLGGCYQAGSITNANLDWILRSVLLIAEDEFTIRHRASGQVITPSNNPVVPGDYDILSEGRITVSDEAWLARAITFSTSAREDAFCTRVRNRDGRCVISGTINRLAGVDMWAGFEAAHMFPRGYENLWTEFGYGRWITNMDDTTGVSKINSVQNGLLMSGTLHTCFNQYLFSINPDDGYKIITFVPDTWGINGRFLDPVCRVPGDINRVSDKLLRWHFRQSVLANMRGAGEPIFETDFPPGTDKMAALRSEPYGKERFEMELQHRFESKLDMALEHGANFNITYHILGS